MDMLGGVPILGLKAQNCLQCGIEYKPRSEKQLICNLCISALSRMNDFEQAFILEQVRMSIRLHQTRLLLQIRLRVARM